jgi:hypothetical protein
MFEFIQWLGIGGVTGGLLIAWLVPSLLPAFAVRALAGLADGISEGVRFVGGRLNAGGSVIFSNGPATFTLIVAVLVSGWAGDRYEFLRPSLPEWLQSEPAPVTEYKRKEAAKATARPKQPQTTARAPASKPRGKSTLQEITCALKPGGCAQ